MNLRMPRMLQKLSILGQSGCWHRILVLVNQCDVFHLLAPRHGMSFDHYATYKRSGFAIRRTRNSGIGKLFVTNELNRR